MRKTLLLSVAAVMFTAMTYGQTRTAREKTILNIFGRLNLAIDPYDDLFCWTDGFAYYRPFFSDIRELGIEPRADGNIIYLVGGTNHEGGYGISIQLAADGKMTIAEEDWRFKKGDRVEYRVVKDEPLLIIKDVRTGAIKDILKKFNGRLYDRYVDDIYNYILAGSFKRQLGNNDIIKFDRDKSVVSGLISKGETEYNLIDDFEDTPVPIFRISEKIAFKAKRILIGIELVPMCNYPEGDDDWMLMEDESKPTITLVKITEESDFPQGRFPLVSNQVMTLTELEMYAGEPNLQNLKIMRNEIYARYGYKFKTRDMADFFGTQDWYYPQFDDVTSKLTEIEQINIALIQVLEKR